MSETLKCPFCGGGAEPHNPFGDVEGTWCVLCSECGAATGFERNEAEAIAAWNTRAADKPETFHDDFYDCESTVDAGEDTREKLEADVRGKVVYSPMIDKNTDAIVASVGDAIGWLDRQAAITEREFIHSHPVCGGSDTCHATNLLNSESVEREMPQTAENVTSKDEIRDFDVWSVAYEIYCAGGWVDNGNEPSPPTDGIWKLLDRQAAITDREGREAWHKAASGEIYQAKREADELREKYNDLLERRTKVDCNCDCCNWQKERDELRERVAGLEAELAAREDYPNGFVQHSELFERLGDAERERDELRRQVSELRELNDSLHARIESAREVLS